MSDDDENPWPRLHFENDPKRAADNLSPCSRRFLLAHARGEKKPVVPDSVWHGHDCWVIEMNGISWRIHSFAREVMAVLAAGED